MFKGNSSGNDYVLIKSMKIKNSLTFKGARYTHEYRLLRNDKVLFEETVSPSFSSGTFDIYDIKGTVVRDDSIVFYGSNHTDYDFLVVPRKKRDEFYYQKDTLLIPLRLDAGNRIKEL